MIANNYIIVQSGAWYWRYGAAGNYGDLNNVIDRTQFSDKINFERANAGVHGKPDKDRAEYWDKVGKETVYNQNTFGNMGGMLKALGMTATNQRDYNTKFGIPLAKRDPVPIKSSGSLLLSSNVLEADEAPSNALLQELMNDFGIFSEEVDMLILDMPQGLAQDRPAVVQVASSEKAKKNSPRSIGVCFLSPTAKQIDDPNVPGGSNTGFSPEYDANRPFLSNIPAVDRYANPVFDEGAHVEVLKFPDHGKMEPELGGIGFSYHPNPGYTGKDRVIFLVTNPVRRQMKVIYFIDVNEKYAEENPYKKYCPREWWKISYPTQPDASTNDLASWQRTSDLMTLLASARQSVTGFTDLPGAALAQTTGTYNSGQIVLDTTAAGHTWYLDPTPFDNTDDYLPTADPNIWKAIPGSAADGKMDLLSVLLHEYGHVLGLQHSGDPRNFMAATLQPGERRLPSAAELQLMANLVAQIKAEPDNTPNPASGQGNNPALPTGQRTPNQPLARRRPELSEALAGMISYQGAVNPTLLNGTFGQNNTDGWVAQGDITVSGSTVTLNESLTMQTHLAQGFMVNEGDHTLSFTLTDQHLTPNASGPSDAFEVALLDANTGLPVVGTVDLTRSDALLNIQTDGAERLAQGVSKVINPNGSATYTITLPDSLAGTPVLLSFDLLGFGAAQSRIILADIHLNG